MQEMAKMVDEDKIIPHSDAHRKFDIPSSGRKNSGYPGSIAGDYGGGQVGTCEQCGGMSYEGQCLECDTCGCSEGNCAEGDCGTMEEDMMSLNEGNCGCGGSVNYDDDGSDYSTDSMLANHPLGDYSNLNNTNITPNQAFSAGYEVSDFDDEVYGLGATSMHIDFPRHGEVHKHKHNNYMAKPSLYKVAKYSQKLLQMIPDGYELDDWQRTKIAQISDDISEVYHSLDYDFYDDEC
tara:strand:+ start:5964 stop:6671 length:708 start_codon:yes stop_codon:yes gene_type:complete